MPNCPECETELNIGLDEVDEGDVVACEECGSEYEVVGIDPLELAKVENDIIEENDLFAEEEEEE
jgi:alpha-aminoadipate carrier protein LysW